MSQRTLSNSASRLLQCRIRPPFMNVRSHARSVAMATETAAKPPVARGAERTGEVARESAIICSYSLCYSLRRASGQTARSCGMISSSRSFVRLIKQCKILHQLSIGCIRRHISWSCIRFIMARTWKFVADTAEHGCKQAGL